MFSKVLFGLARVTVFGIEMKCGKGAYSSASLEHGVSCCGLK